MSDTMELTVERIIEADSLSLEMESELREAVRKRSDVPLKFCYLDYGANLWDGVSTDPDYELGERERITLQKALPIASTYLEKHLNVLHVGVGNGVEAPLILDAVSPAQIESYGLLDISAKMIGLARRRIRSSFPLIHLSEFHCDVEKKGVENTLQALRHQNSSQTLITLIAHGGLLSNFELLPLIRSGMSQSDRLLVTLELFDEVRQEEIFASYRLRSVEALLSRGLAHLGYKVKEDSLSVSYNAVNSCLNVHAMPELLPTSFGALDYELMDSTPLRLLSSYKPSEENFLKRLAASGLHAVYFTHFREWGCCAALCKPA
ncbi:MAG TPA: class I SAM-dependent methyltransferase [Pyrinomonadaceae bacterium]|jgi:hypothetical protein